MGYPRRLEPKGVKHALSQIPPRIKQRFTRFLKQNKCYASYTTYFCEKYSLTANLYHQLIITAFFWGDAPQGWGYRLNIATMWNAFQQLKFKPLKMSAQKLPTIHANKSP